MSQHGYQPSFRSSLQQEGTMDLYIETLTGTAFEMTVSPFDTVMSIKSKIQRVEGIPVSHQHLLYNLQELDDSACLIDYSIQDGATLKLVLSMRGGPISTRRLPPGEELAWKELREFVESNREDMFERLPPGCRVTVLVFREGDQVNLFRVIENEDGTYSPLSESWSGSSIRNLFAEEEPEEASERLQENSVTMGKMQELRNRMERLSLQKKPKKPAPRVLSAKRPLLHNRRGTPRPHHNRKTRSPELSEVSHTKSETNILHLPPINKPERNVTSPSLHQQHSIGNNYLTTSSLLKVQNQTHIKQNKHYETRLFDTSEHDNNSTPTTHSNQHSRRSLRHVNLPPIVSTSVSLSASKKPAHSTGKNGPIFDAKPRRNNEYGHGRGITSESHNGKSKNLREDLSVNQSISVMSTPNIAIVEEESDARVEKEEPNFSVSSNPIIVPSKEATTFTISQIPQERVTTALNSGQNRYKVSRLVLEDDDDRPKTSPEELTEHQKAALELCDIISETKWHKQRQQRIHYSNSQLEIIGDFPAEQAENEKEPKNFLQREEKSTIDLSLPIQSSLIDVTIRSPRYGRRSVILPSAKNRDVRYDRAEHSTSTSNQMELSPENRSVRQSRRKLSSSGRSTLLQPAQKFLGEIGRQPPSLSSEVTSQSITYTPPKKQSTVRSRCSVCRKRLNITNIYSCRCDKLFCAAHRYSELHNCTFDYKTEGRKILEQTNPLVTAPKLPKI